MARKKVVPDDSSVVATEAPAIEPTAPDDRVERFSSTLKCVLSPDEIAKRADRAANLVARIADKTDEAKAAAKHAKAEIEQLEAELRQLSGEVASRVTYRQVECERRYVFSENVIRETRLDNFDLINSRKMTAAERQLHLPLPDEDETWRDVALSETPVMNLGERIIDTLGEHGITTLGTLSDFQAEHGDAWHQKVKGIGAETALKIADAAAEWWR